MKRYKFAGIEVEVNALDGIMYEDEHVLAEFSAEDVSNPHTFTFERVDTIGAPIGKLIASFPNYRTYINEEEQMRYIGSVLNSWENAYMMVIHRGKEHQVKLQKGTYDGPMGTNTLLNAMSAEHLVLEANGVILHNSFISHNGKAILFTAPSGTGKSTQAELWKEHRKADIINGDRAVIRLIDGKAYACGIPFAGSSKYCKNETLPIEAIVYLKQSPTTTIKKLNAGAAFKKVWGECTVNTWNPEDVEKATSIVLNIVGQVPAYELACTPDESAIIALENELNNL